MVIKNNPWFQELNFTIFCDGKRVSIIFYPTIEKKEWEQGMRSEFSLVIWACKRWLVAMEMLSDCGLGWGTDIKHCLLFWSLVSKKESLKPVEKEQILYAGEGGKMWTWGYAPIPTPSTDLLIPHVFTFHWDTPVIS